MHVSEYKNIYLSESRHFYYVGYHLIIIQLLKKYLAAKNQKKLQILDAGCGSGLFSQRLEFFGRVQAIDINKQALIFAQKRGVKVKRATVTELPFKNSSFDLIVCLDVLYHQAVKDETSAMREFSRVLKTDGILVLKLPAFNFLKDSHDILVKTRRRYSLKEVEDLVANTGFSILKATYLGSFLLLPKIISCLKDHFFHSLPHSKVQLPNRCLNSLLIYLFKVEGWLLNFIDLPVGITTLLIVTKKD